GGGRSRSAARRAPAARGGGDGASEASERRRARNDRGAHPNGEDPELLVRTRAEGSEVGSLQGRRYSSGSSPSCLPWRIAFRRSSRRLARSAARFTSSEPTSSTIACSAPSPLRFPSRTTRV